jgi:hypothetical protein
MCGSVHRSASIGVGAQPQAPGDPGMRHAREGRQARAMGSNQQREVHGALLRTKSPGYPADVKLP